MGEYGVGTQTLTDTQINTMTRPGLGAGPSENNRNTKYGSAEPQITGLQK